MTHELTIRKVHKQVRTLHGPVPLLLGWEGVCSCGQHSQVEGLRDTVRLWHEWHTTPVRDRKT